jgi:hypothetical protein
VHAINLVAAGTHEASLLARLVRRLDQMRDTLGPVDEVLGSGGDMAVAGILADDPGAVVPWSGHVTPAPAAPPSSPVERLSLGAAALGERARLTERRAVRVALARHTRRRTRRGGARAGRHPSPMIAAIPARRLRGRYAQSGAIAVYRATTVDETGRLIDSALLPLFTPFMLPHLGDRREVAAKAREWLSLVRRSSDALALRFATNRLETTSERRNRELAAGFQRSRAQQLVSIGQGLMIQGGLFDRRNEREAEQRKRERDEPEWLPADQTTVPVTVNGVALAEHPLLQFILMVTP